MQSGSNTNFSLFIDSQRINNDAKCSYPWLCTWIFELPELGLHNLTVVVDNSLVTLTAQQILEVQPTLSAPVVNLLQPCGMSVCPFASVVTQSTIVTFKIITKALRVDASFSITDNETQWASDALDYTNGYMAYVFHRQLNDVGNFVFTFEASNNVSRNMTKIALRVVADLYSIQMNELTPALINEEVHFQAQLDSSSVASTGIMVTWHFGDGVSFQTGTDLEASHTFNRIGVYNVTVSISNGIWSLNRTAVQIIQSSVCLPPTIFLGNEEAALRYTPLDSISLSSSIIYNCTTFSTIGKKWDVLLVPGYNGTETLSTNEVQNLVSSKYMADLPVFLASSSTDATLTIPPLSLPTGVYVFRLTATMTNSYPVISNAAGLVVAIAPTPGAVALINGSASSSGAWQRRQPLILDGSASFDPNNLHNHDEFLSFQWSCRSAASITSLTNGTYVCDSSTECFTSVSFVLPPSSTLSIPANVLRSDRNQFDFTLSVGRIGQPCSVNSCQATIVVYAFDAPIIDIHLLVDGGSTTINSQEKVVLRTVCDNCNASTLLSYAWGDEPQSSSSSYPGCSNISSSLLSAKNSSLTLTPPLSDLALMGTSSSILLLRSGAITSSRRIAVAVVDNFGRKGYAAITLNVRKPPLNGTCILTNTSGANITQGFELTTEFVISCYNWSSATAASSCINCANSPGLIFTYAMTDLKTGLQSILGGGTDVHTLTKLLPRGDFQLTITIADIYGAENSAELRVTVTPLSAQAVEESITQLVSGQYAILSQTGDVSGQRALAVAICTALNSAPLTSSVYGNTTQSVLDVRKALRKQFIQDLGNGTTGSQYAEADASTLLAALGGSTAAVDELDSSTLLNGAQVLHGLSSVVGQLGSSTTTPNPSVINLLQASSNLIQTLAWMRNSTSITFGSTISQLVSRGTELLAASLTSSAVVGEPVFQYDVVGAAFLFAVESEFSSPLQTASSSFTLPSSTMSNLGLGTLSNHGLLATMHVYDMNPYDVVQANVQSKITSLTLQNRTSSSPLVVFGLKEDIIINIPIILTTTPASVPAPASSASGSSVNLTDGSSNIQMTSVSSRSSRTHSFSHGLTCSDCATHILVKPLSVSSKDNVNKTVSLSASLSYVERIATNAFGNASYLGLEGPNNITSYSERLSITTLWDENSSTVSNFALVIPPPTYYASLFAFLQRAGAASFVLNGSSSFGSAGNYTLNVDNLLDNDVIYSVEVFQSNCMFWNETIENWDHSGCQAGADTLPTMLQCRCNHLTSFAGSCIVVPNYVDPISSAGLFSNLQNNAVIFSVVIVVWAAYLVGVYFARRADKRDELMVGPIILPENRPTHQAAYEVLVLTGARPNAGTNSNVYIQMYGLFGQSAARRLYHPWRPIFERNSADIFYLTLPTTLGPLQRIRIWHDMVDDTVDGSWFLNRVRITDLITGEVWYFPCGRWLALDLDDGLVERTIDAVPEEAMRNFTTAFHDSVSNGFSDGHIWLSVFVRPPRSRFTRVQRLTCVLCLLFLTMLTSLMFYRINGSNLTFQQELFTGVTSALIIFPIIYIFIFLFRNSRARNTGNDTRPGTASSKHSADSSMLKFG